jgi:hypothetical protein
MSVNIATMGKFKDCCGVVTVGGGAPPYRRDEQHVVPFIRVQQVDIIDIKVFDKHKIDIKLVDN